eukprot:g8636.t1
MASPDHQTMNDKAETVRRAYVGCGAMSPPFDTEGDVKDPNVWTKYGVTPVHMHPWICCFGGIRCNFSMKTTPDPQFMNETGVSEAEFKVLVEKVGAEVQRRRKCCFRTGWLGPLCPPFWFLWQWCDFQVCCEGCMFRYCCAQPMVDAVKTIVDTQPLENHGVTASVLMRPDHVTIGNGVVTSDIRMDFWLIQLEWIPRT